MTKTTFKANPISLEEILRDCGCGKIQLPDFQRSWVWDEERIKSLIASISQAFPVGALMTLEIRAGAPQGFARRPIQGAFEGAADRNAEQLLLDGQQRMTSLYQTCMRDQVVATITPRQRLVSRWFYIDIELVLSGEGDREGAILTLPPDRKIKENFNKTVLRDLSTPEAEYRELVFPLNHVFDWDSWQTGFDDYWLERGDKSKREIFKKFKNEVLQNFKSYQVPVIALGADTSHAAVCLVFEKVNTGGKALDAFELVTAMYASQGFRLRDDWLGHGAEPGILKRLQKYGHASGRDFGILEKIQSTDLLQAISLLHTKSVRDAAANQGVRGSDLPAVRATRQSLLELPLSAYLARRDSVITGFEHAAKFLRQQGIFRVLDLPYQSQLVPLAAILADIGTRWEHAENKAKLARWFWCGIFGELYGSAAETRFAKDIQEVPAWIAGGSLPTTIRDGQFRTDRLKSMYTRQSAAYKGLHALLLKHGAEDFRTGQPYDATIFFDEDVDIHHIFPVDWCTSQGIEKRIYDSVINKTPLSYRTNRKIGGIAPSLYLQRLECGIGDDPQLDSERLNRHLSSHCINPTSLRTDDFAAFLADRERRLLTLITEATGHDLVGTVVGGIEAEEGEDVPENIARDVGYTVQAAE